MERGSYSSTYFGEKSSSTKKAFEKNNRWLPGKNSSHLFLLLFTSEFTFEHLSFIHSRLSIFCCDFFFLLRALEREGDLTICLVGETRFDIYSSKFHKLQIIDLKKIKQHTHTQKKNMIKLPLICVFIIICGVSMIETNFFLR